MARLGRPPGMRTTHEERPPQKENPQTDAEFYRIECQITPDMTNSGRDPMRRLLQEGFERDPDYENVSDQFYQVRMPQEEYRARIKETTRLYKERRDGPEDTITTPGVSIKQLKDKKDHLDPEVRAAMDKLANAG